MSGTPRSALLDALRHRRNAVRFASRAETTGSPREREHWALMARTSDLLARNAEWMQAMDRFLAEQRGADDVE